MPVKKFFNNPDLADGFGATKGRQRPHRGLDFPKPEGTPIPALLPGVVVINGTSGELGYVIEVEYDGGRRWKFMGHCHMLRPGLKLGTRFQAGDTLGYTGNTGTATTGPHDHVTLGDRRGAVFGASMDYLTNPWPLIQAVIRIGSAAGNPAAPTSKGRTKMLMIHRPNAGRKGQTLYAVFADGFWLEFVGQDTANGFARQIGASSVEVSEAFWNTCKSAAKS